MENIDESVIMKMYDKLYDPERYAKDTPENIAAKKCLDNFFETEKIEKSSALYERIMSAVSRHYETVSPYVFKCGFVLGMKLALEVLGDD